MIEIADDFVETDEGGKLWLGRMGDPNGVPVLLIHGAIENSLIFYTKKGKGLAPFLAEKGFDVFVTDLRGKGKSLPAACSRNVKGGQFEVITKDIPLIINRIRKLNTTQHPLQLIAHSWGGVLISSWFARFEKSDLAIGSMVFFACKRKIYVQHFRRWFMVDIMWTGLGSFATMLAGYLPAKKLKLGSDDEPAKFFFECNKWVYSNKWVDGRDGFDYNTRFKEIKFPPVLSLTGLNDHSLGNKYCVQKMLAEIKPEFLTSLLLSKKNGNRNDYGHVDILTHPDAPTDHFPIVLNWLNQHK